MLRRRALSISVAMSRYFSPSIQPPHRSNMLQRSHRSHLVVGIAEPYRNKDGPRPLDDRNKGDCNDTEGVITDNRTGSILHQCLSDDKTFLSVNDTVNIVQSYVKVGDIVKRDQPLCTIEWMKWVSDVHALLPGEVIAYDGIGYDVPTDQPFITIHYIPDRL